MATSARSPSGGFALDGDGGDPDGFAGACDRRGGDEVVDGVTEERRVDADGRQVGVDRVVHGGPEREFARSVDQRRGDPGVGGRWVSDSSNGIVSVASPPSILASLTPSDER